MLSGITLSASEEILLAFPIIILILPAQNGMIGNISTIFISRLSSHLYLGVIPAEIKVKDQLRKDIFGLALTLFLSIVSLLLIGFLFSHFMQIPINNIWKLAFILLIAPFLLLLVMMFAFLSASIILFKRGKDPNNYLVPLSTSLADFLMPLMIVLLIKALIF
jgi:mgtE-like transporter